MLDLSWERSIPLIAVDDEMVRKCFFEFAGDIRVYGYTAVQSGCRNSNFAVDTNQGRYLLRFAYSAELNNERIASRAFYGSVPMPALLFYTAMNGMNAFIYEYIDGISLQQHIVERNQCDAALLRQAAQAAAIIHCAKREDIAGFQEFDTPAFQTWYSCFMENPHTKCRLGDDLYTRLNRLLCDRQAMLDEIDMHYSVIHSDFRPANMIVDRQDNVYIIDWEYICFGHFLADIGQFFRYRRFFGKADYFEFGNTYNQYADNMLPDGWIELSMLRDLVNPLQMLSTVDEQPLKHKDLLNNIRETVHYFGF